MPRFAANLSFMFTEVPFLDRFEAAAKAGFTAVEYLFPYEFQAVEIAARLQSHGLTQVLFNLPAGDWSKGERGLVGIANRDADFQAALQTALDYARSTGCRRLHAMPGLKHHGADRKTYVANLRKACKAAAAEGVDIVIEPINTRDIPGFLLNTTAEARAVIHEVGAANLGLQFDLYHRQIQEGDVTMAIREFGHLARHYQVASPPDRGEPDDGELNYRYLFNQIDATGFDGWIGLEYKPRAGTVAGLKWAAACGVELG